MFSKTLFLVVLCCAAVVINAYPEPQPKSQESINDKVKAYFKKLDHKLRNLVEKIGNAWRKFWDRVTGKESKQQKAEIEALKNELQSVQYQSSIEVAALRAEWHAKLKAQEEELERLRGDKEAFAAEKKRLEELQKQAAAAIAGVLNDWDEKTDELGDRIDQALQ